jgi:hypothetical protein
VTTSPDTRPTLLPTDLTARIDFLKSLCDFLTIATVVNDDTPNGYSWEVVGICENDDHPEEVVAGHGFTVAGAVTDAIVHSAP